LVKLDRRSCASIAHSSAALGVSVGVTVAVAVGSRVAVSLGLSDGLSVGVAVGTRVVVELDAAVGASVAVGTTSVGVALAERVAVELGSPDLSPSPSQPINPAPSNKSGTATIRRVIRAIRILRDSLARRSAEPSSQSATTPVVRPSPPSG
jgi:hypothetical protein